MYDGVEEVSAAREELGFGLVEPRPRQRIYAPETRASALSTVLDGPDGLPESIVRQVQTGYFARPRKSGGTAGGTTRNGPQS
jgi:hypothetical protein